MEESLQDSIKRGIHIMMDSGAHSFHRFALNVTGQQTSKKRKSFVDVELLKTQTRDQYAEFCLEQKQDWDFYVNLDFKKDCPTIYKMQRWFEKKGLKPVPVFHGDSSLDWFKRYCDEGHKLIGIGLSNKSSHDARQSYYDIVFNEAEKRGIKLHGFAVTAMSYMVDYPWYSVDSTTWAKCAVWGKILYVDPNRHVIGALHISDRECVGDKNSYNRMPVTIQKQIRAQCESKGFDFDKLRSSDFERCVWNACLFKEIGEGKVKLTAKERVQWERLL
jgi:hypothetical protein